jgi:N12 class adenine-specific DNA methylase/phospholipid N-methyltransferase
MGITHKKRHVREGTSWLPGFEPEEILRAQSQSDFAFPSFAMPSPVALVTAALVDQAIGSLPTPSITRTTLATVIREDEDTNCTATAQVEQGQSVEETSEEESTQARRHWPHFDLGRFTPGDNIRGRIDKNLAAIQCMQDLRRSGQEPTDEQRHQMLEYSGWGGAARMFESLAGNSLEPLRAALQALVTEEEFSSARASVTSAYYTDTVVIDAMWKMIRRLGFLGGRVIEPTAGTGLFVAGMPKDIAERSDITAVEMDKLSAAILEQSFAGLGVQVHCSPLEKAPLPHGFYDLAVSNVPFGNYKSLETSTCGYSEWSIHNYCLAKSIDLVRPGGLVVMVTSSYTMDSQTQSHRGWINAHAQLLGAFRLPRGAFKKSAATEVVTDILVLQKRAAPHYSAPSKWLSLKEAPIALMRAGQQLTQFVKTSSGYRDVNLDRSINQWYADHPHAVIGELVLETGSYSRGVVSTVFAGDVQAMGQRLVELAESLPQDVYQPAEQRVVHKQSLLLKTVEASSQVKPGAFVLKQGRICIGQDARRWIDVDDAYSGKVRERLLGLMAIRQVARELIAVQIESNSDAQFRQLQTELNIRYDAFIAKHGNVGDSANFRVFRSDPDCPLVLSLERYDEDTEKYCKADIFSKRTAGRKTPPERADNVRDAMLIAMGIYGRIHIADMAQRMGKRPVEVTKELQNEGLAYIDPQSGHWTPADEYLAGNIRAKINAAKAGGPKFIGNVLALEKVVPRPLGPADVEVRLGAPWVPASIVQQFANELVDIKDASRQVTITYSAQAATWSLTTHTNDRRYSGSYVLNNTTWGTDKRCALELIEAALNQVPPKVMKTSRDGKSVLDRSATMAAREKYEVIRQEFKAWAYRDDQRRDALLAIYNDQFNQIVERRYDGSHLMLYGMSPVIVPYQHQMDAIWRIVSGGNTLLAHVVGAGKTFTMIAAAMEMRRIGKANKPLMVVPNHLLHQFVSDCVRFYPTAKVLMATKEDLLGDKRMEFCARVATGDWDGVVMTQSTFERIAVSPETKNRFINELLAQVRNTMAMADESKSKRTVKECEKMIKAIEAKCERELNEKAKDDFVAFDLLGVDYLMYDEAHALKNLMRVSKMPPIAGLSNASSNRAFDAWIKMSLVMEVRGGKEEGVVLSTATPIANSCAEMAVMMKYLQPQTLKRLGIYEFDAWAATFGDTVTGMEISPDGGGYRLNTRFARFTNVPDLMAIFRQVADIKTRSMVKLPTPNVHSGKATIITSQSSQALLDYTAELVARADKIRNGQVKPKDDNMLAVTGCGRKAALDMRLIDGTLPFDPLGKVATLVERVTAIWRDTLDKRGTQLVFCDMSTPSTKGFSVYNDVKQRLIAAGIPESEIQFIQDFTTDTAKAKLFRDVRAGNVRVLMGSTQMMGVGTNVQTRLKAVHQLDAPWKPSCVEQRDGRGLRAGNMWDEIYLYRYVTVNSLDTYVWHLLETKQRFIEQVMVPGSGVRSVEDIAMGALTYAEIKAIASGNPLVLEKATVDAKVMKYMLLRQEWEENRWALSRKADANLFAINAASATMSALKVHAQQIAQAVRDGIRFEPKGVYGVKASDLDCVESSIGTQIYHISRSFAEYGETLVGSIAGMDVVFSRGANLVVGLRSPNSTELQFEVHRKGVPLTDTFGTGKLVLDVLKSIVDEPELRSTRIERMKREIADIRTSKELPYEHEAILKELVLRQRAIEAELELDKDDAGVDAEAETCA